MVVSVSFRRSFVVDDAVKFNILKLEWSSSQLWSSNDICGQIKRDQNDKADIHRRTYLDQTTPYNPAL